MIKISDHIVVADNIVAVTVREASLSEASLEASLKGRLVIINLFTALIKKGEKVNIEYRRSTDAWHFHNEFTLIITPSEINYQLNYQLPVELIDSIKLFIKRNIMGEYIITLEDLSRDEVFKNITDEVKDQVRRDFRLNYGIDDSVEKVIRLKHNGEEFVFRLDISAYYEDDFENSFEDKVYVTLHLAGAFDKYTKQNDEGKDIFSENIKNVWRLKNVLKNEFNKAVADVKLLNYL